MAAFGAYPAGAFAEVITAMTAEAQATTAELAAKGQQIQCERNHQDGERRPKGDAEKAESMD